MDEGSVSMETERLLLRPWGREEAERLLDIRRRPDIAAWLADPEPWTDIATAHDAIDAWAAITAKPDPLGVWAICAREPEPDELGPAGTVSLKELPDGEVDIGWYLHPDSGGRGYAAEAARAVLDRALAAGVPRVWAVMWPHNDASGRVAAAAGMKDLGVVADPWYGTPEDPVSRVFRFGDPGGPELTPAE